MTTHPEKLCFDCYRQRFPGKPVGMTTWGRECTQCHKPTPSLSMLVKVERERQEVTGDQPNP